MEQKKVKCPNCNRESYINEKAEHKICPHCGSEIVLGNNIDVPSKNIVVLASIIIIVVAVFVIFKIKVNVEEVRYSTNEDNNIIDNTKTNKNTELEDNTSIEVKESPNYTYNADLSSIKKEKGKVNVYIFWGNGCPHCTEAHNFFDNIREEYKDKFNLYGFETWYNDNNRDLFRKFVDAMKDNVSGVPYIIIGSEKFHGYIRDWDDDILNAIKNESNKDFDIYIDVLKKKIN